MLVIRHGESQFNTRQTYDYNSSLSVKGHKQAEELCHYLDGYAIGSNVRQKKIICSPFARCIQTAAYISCYMGLNIEIDNRLIEHIHEKNGFHFRHSNIYCINSELSIKMSDSDSRIINRVISFYEQYKDENVIVVTHGGPINIIQHLMKNKSLSEYPEWNPEITNCSVTDTVLDTFENFKEI